MLGVGLGLEDGGQLEQLLTGASEGSWSNKAWGGGGQAIVHTMACPPPLPMLCLLRAIRRPWLPSTLHHALLLKSRSFQEPDREELRASIFHIPSEYWRHLMQGLTHPPPPPIRHNRSPHACFHLRYFVGCVVSGRFPQESLKMTVCVCVFFVCFCCCLFLSLQRN